MLSVETALDRIIEHVQPLAPIDVELGAALGLVLAGAALFRDKPA